VDVREAFFLIGFADFGGGGLQGDFIDHAADPQLDLFFQRAGGNGGVAEKNDFAQVGAGLDDDGELDAVARGLGDDVDVGRHPGGDEVFDVGVAFFLSVTAADPQAHVGKDAVAVHRAAA